MVSVFLLLFSFFLAYSQLLQIGLSANLECGSEKCCTRVAENTGCKKSPSAHHRTTVGLYLCNLRHVSALTQYALAKLCSVGQRRELQSFCTTYIWQGSHHVEHHPTFYFFSHLFSALADCMSNILPHMKWP